MRSATCPAVMGPRPGMSATADVVAEEQVDRHGDVHQHRRTGVPECRDRSRHEGFRCRLPASGRGSASVVAGRTSVAPASQASSSANLAAWSAGHTHVGVVGRVAPASPVQSAWWSECRSCRVRRVADVSAQRSQSSSRGVRRSPDRRASGRRTGLARRARRCPVSGSSHPASRPVSRMPVSQVDQGVDAAVADVRGRHRAPGRRQRAGCRRPRRRRRLGRWRTSAAWPSRRRTAGGRGRGPARCCRWRRSAAGGSSFSTLRCARRYSCRSVSGSQSSACDREPVHHRGDLGGGVVDGVGDRGGLQLADPAGAQARRSSPGAPNVKAAARSTSLERLDVGDAQRGATSLRSELDRRRVVPGEIRRPAGTAARRVHSPPAGSARTSASEHACRAATAGLLPVACLPDRERTSLLASDDCRARSVGCQRGRVDPASVSGSVAMPPRIDAR